MYCHEKDCFLEDVKPQFVKKPFYVEIRYWRPFVTSAPLSWMSVHAYSTAHAHHCIFQSYGKTTVAIEIEHEIDYT